MQAFNCRENKWEYVEPAPLTDEEIAELEKLPNEIPAPEPTPEERIAALEQDNAELRDALDALLLGVTA